MKQVFILRGLPGSGKSYYAQNLAEELSGAMKANILFAQQMITLLTSKVSTILISLNYRNITI